MRVPEPFSPLITVYKALAVDNDKLYRVYTSESEFIMVEADTAGEAIAASGIEHPHKLFHILPHTETFLTESQLKIIKKPEEITEAATEQPQETEVVTEEIVETKEAEDIVSEEINPPPTMEEQISDNAS